MTQEKCDQDYERNRLYEKEEINIRLKEGEKPAHQNEPLGLYIAFPLSFLFLTSSLFVLSRNVKKLSKPESLFIEMERKETLNTDGAKKVNKELLSLRSKISKEPRRECPISFPSLSELTQEEYHEIPTEEYSRYLDELHRLQRKQRKEVSRSKRTEIFNKYKNSSLNNSDDNVLVEYDTASFAKSYERTSRFEGASLSINNESTLLKSILKPSNVKRSKKSKKSKELKKVSFNKEDEIKLFYTYILPKV